MQLTAASQSFISWQRGGRGAFCYGKKLPARARILWSATHPSARLQHPTPVVVLDLLVTISLLPPIHCHMGYRVRPLINATGASQPGFDVVRHSTFTLEDSIRLSRRITELHAGTGGLQRSVKLLERVPGVIETSEDNATDFRVLGKAWPAAVRLPQENELFHHCGRIANLVQSAAPCAKSAITSDKDAEPRRSGRTVPLEGRPAQVTSRGIHVGQCVGVLGCPWFEERDVIRKFRQYQATALFSKQRRVA